MLPNPHLAAFGGICSHWYVYFPPTEISLALAHSESEHYARAWAIGHGPWCVVLCDVGAGAFAGAFAGAGAGTVHWPLAFGLWSLS